MDAHIRKHAEHTCAQTFAAIAHANRRRHNTHRHGKYYKTVLIVLVFFLSLHLGTCVLAAAAGPCDAIDDPGLTAYKNAKVSGELSGIGNFPGRKRGNGELVAPYHVLLDRVPSPNHIPVRVRITQRQKVYLSYDYQGLCSQGKIPELYIEALHLRRVCPSLLAFLLNLSVKFCIYIYVCMFAHVHGCWLKPCLTCKTARTRI